MKIAIYTIAKNEEQFVEDWYNSAKDADYLLIADTGSTDNTVHIAERQPPKPRPEDGLMYFWNEESLDWEAVKYE